MLLRFALFAALPCFLDVQAGLVTVGLPGHCPSPWEDSTSDTSKCYYSPPGKVTWSAAQARCWQVGGQLVSVSGLEENWQLGFLPNDVDNYWIGLQWSNGNWSWTDKSPVKTLRWAKNEPSINGGWVYSENRLAVWHTTTDADAVYNVICERFL